MNNQLTFSNTDNITNCLRCGAKCKIEPIPGSKARLLKRGNKEGLCLSCAVHDWLRNTYPINMLLAGMQNPQNLLLPDIQEQFAGILKVGFSDAKPDEIDWQQIVDNWDLPFPTKVKRSAMNPMSQEELDREPHRLADERKWFEESMKPKEQRQKERDEKVSEVMSDFLNAVNPDRPKRKYHCHENSKNSIHGEGTGNIEIDGYEDL